jgi:uncharacterized protein (TIGR00299 family) protein
MSDGHRVLYIEPFSGISGDMMLGALVDLGIPLSFMEDQLRDMDLDDRINLSARRVGRSGVMGTKVDVVVDGTVESPSDAMPPPGHDGHHAHGAAATDASEILGRISSSRLEPGVRETSLKVFHRLVDAEARVHGSDEENVHLHEVGALDAVADVVCSVAGVAMLEVDSVVSAHPREGHGEARAAHGTLPVPAPATAYLLEGIPHFRVDVPCELVTPTGAALLTTLADRFTEQISIATERVAYGAGTRELEGRPNLLRMSLGRELAEPGTLRDQVIVMETVVDDANPEIWPYLIERLLDAGARDAWLDPVMMKKGRPGVHLTVLSDPETHPILEQIVFEETGTLGIRTTRADRTVLRRTTGTLETDLGPLQVKLSRLPRMDGWRVHPEYEICRRLAQEKGIPLRSVYAAVRRAASRADLLDVESEDLQ